MNTTPIADNSRIGWVDSMKTLAMGLVVYYHTSLCSVDFLSQPTGPIFVHYFIRALLSAGVPLFFFVNGYLLLTRPYDSRKHLHRTLRLFYLSLVWSAVEFLFAVGIRREPISIAELLLAMIRLKPGYNSFLWFLRALVGVYLFFPLLKAAYDRSPSLLLTFTAISWVMTFGNSFLNTLAALAVGFGLGQPWPEEGNNFFFEFNLFHRTFYPAVYFCAGGLVHCYGDRLKAALRKPRMAAWLLLGFCCTGLFGVGFLYSTLYGKIWDPVWSGYDSVFTFGSVLALWLLLSERRTCGRFCRLIASGTLSIYLIHPMFELLLLEPLKQVPLFRTVLGGLFWSAVIGGLSLLAGLLLQKSFLRKILGL